MVDRRKRILAALVVISALCVERATTAEPAVRPVVDQPHGFVQRLAGRFRELVPCTQLRGDSTERYQTIHATVARSPLPVVVHLAQCSPFQFRLPPPAMPS
jgi:hypothetical protein